MANDFLYALGDNPIGESVRGWAQLLSNLGNKDNSSVKPNQAAQVEQVAPTRGSAYLNPEGAPAFRGRSYTPEEINQLFPQATNSGPFSPSVDTSALAEKAGPIFNTADIKSGTTVNPQVVQEQVKQEDPFQAQLNSYLNSLTENSKLQGTLTQEQLKQLQGEQARLDEIRSPEHQSMNPLDWASLGLRDVKNLIHFNPSTTKAAFLQEKYSPEEAYASGKNEEARVRNAAMAEVAAQQLNSLLQGGKGLSGFQEMQQGADLYPLSKRLQEARISSAEQAPGIAQSTAQAMADYRAAQAAKLQGELAVALQKAAILQYNREHPDNPIPLSGNNKAPVFDLGGALNMLMGGGSVSQGQTPTSDTTEEDNKALRDAFAQ